MAARDDIPSASIIRMTSVDSGVTNARDDGDRVSAAARKTRRAAPGTAAAATA